MKELTRIAIAVTALLLAGETIARPTGSDGKTRGSEQEWSGRLGMMTMYAPEFEGGNGYELNTFPQFDISWRGRLFLNPRQGLGGYVWQRGGSKLGVSLGYTFGRAEDEADSLMGLGDIAAGANANVMFQRRIGNASVNGKYTQQISGQSTGFEVDLSVGYRLQVSKQLTLLPRAHVRYGSRGYMEEYFTVSRAQSNASGIPPHHASAGVRSVGLQIITSFRLDDRWSVQAILGYSRLTGHAANSPIVQDKDQLRVGAGFSVDF
ncbi:MAG: MipA/OmpV family protein [Planctomycetota bacterium]|jgi:outer membrane scaffolding protein for murein synthesis (MipA/OmpV family)